MRRRHMLQEAAVSLTSRGHPAKRCIAWGALTFAACLASGSFAQPMSERFLFQPLSVQALRLAMTTPACQKEAYPFAIEVHCVGDAQGLRALSRNPQANLVATLRLLPSEFKRPDLGIQGFAVRKLDLGVPGGGFQMTAKVFSVQPAREVGAVTLTLIGEQVVGRITDNGDIYEVRPLNNGLHVIIKANREKRLPLHPLLRAPGAPPSAPGPAASGPVLFPAPAASSPSSGAPTDPSIPTTACSPPTPASVSIPVISVGVVFEIGALPVETNLQSLGTAYVTSANGAMVDSEVDARLALAGPSAIRTIAKFVFTDDALDLLTAGDASTSDPIGDLHRWRAAIKADIVVVVADLMSACGVSQPRPSDPALGFIMVHESCALASWQVAHEIGHVLGGDHQEGTVRSSQSSPYAHAFESPGKQARTVMFSSEPGTMKPYYSNPRVTWAAGSKTEATGEPCKSDNARAISEWAPTISNFFP